MLRRLRFADFVIFALMTAWIAGFWFVLSSFPLPNNQPHQQEQQQASAKNTEKYNGSEFGKFWRKTTEDPVAYFTLWLVVFTAVLSFVSIIQILFLTKSDKTARLSAEAAKKSAEAAEAALSGQAPNLIAEIQSSGIADATESRLFYRQGELKYAFRNLGEKYAIINEIHRKIEPVETGMPKPVTTSETGGAKTPYGVVVAGSAISENYEFCSTIPVTPGAEINYFFIGFVKYSDISGNSSFTNGFCFVYDAITDRFLRIGGEEYNYRKKD